MRTLTGNLFPIILSGTVSIQNLQPVAYNITKTQYNDYTGCFTTLEHNCRRWFPRSLWWKKFI